MKRAAGCRTLFVGMYEAHQPLAHDDLPLLPIIAQMIPVYSLSRALNRTPPRQQRAHGNVRER